MIAILFALSHSLSLSLSFSLSIFSLLYVVGKLYSHYTTQQKCPWTFSAIKLCKFPGDKLCMSNPRYDRQTAAPPVEILFALSSFFSLCHTEVNLIHGRKREISLPSLWCCQSNPFYCYWIDPIYLSA